MKHYALLLVLLVFFACKKTIHTAQESELSSRDYLIDAEDMVRLHIREIKPAQQQFKIPFVMVHGGGPGATSSFDLPVEGGSFARDIARSGFNVFLVNIRGWEKSTLPEYDFKAPELIIGTHQEAARDIRSAVNWILEKEHVDRVNLFGWATGGHWISYYTTKHPETVHKLISLNSLYGVHAAWTLRAFFESPEDSLKFHKTTFFRASKAADLTRAWTRTIPVAEKESWRDPNVEQSYRKVASSFGADTTVMKVPGGYREESFYMSLGKKYWDAKAITVPSLIIRTELDFWSRPEDLKAIEQDMRHAPGSEFLTIPGTHYVFLDKPDRGKQQLINAITAFIETDVKR